MKREKSLEQMIKAIMAGGAITVILFAYLHQGLTPGEVIAFWMGTWFISTYAVWSVIEWVDRRKSRDAWQSNPGEQRRKG